MAGRVLHWSDRFVDEGRAYDPQTYDCACLVERVAHEVFGIKVELPSERRAGARGRQAQIAEGIEDLVTPVWDPRDGDVVLLVTRGRLQHLGVVCVIAGEFWVLQNQKGPGVHRNRLRELERLGYSVEGYYRWK